MSRGTEMNVHKPVKATPIPKATIVITRAVRVVEEVFAASAMRRWTGYGEQGGRLCSGIAEPQTTGGRFRSRFPGTS